MHTIDKAGEGPFHSHPYGEVAEPAQNGRLILEYENQITGEMEREECGPGEHLWISGGVLHKWTLDKGGVIYRSKDWQQRKS